MNDSIRFGLAGRVCIVTGAAQGIGQACVQRLAAEGARVALWDVDDASVNASEAALVSQGVDALALHCNVARKAEVEAALAATVQRFGRVDGLVNNAGIFKAAPFLDITEADWDAVIDVNLKGPYFLTQAVAKWMVEQRQADAAFDGCVVNISSISAEIASINRGDYCMARAGTSMATKLWAVRLAEFGIRVYEIRPGVIATDMTAGVKEKYDRMIAEGLTLEPRWGRPEDIGRAVAALASGESPYATGQVVNIDGGMMIGRL